MAPKSFENHTFSLNSAFFPNDNPAPPQYHEFWVELPMQDGTYQRRRRGQNSKQRNPWDQPIMNFDTATLDAREIDTTSRANVFQLPSPQTPSNLPLVVPVEVWDQDSSEIQNLGWGAHWHDRSSFGSETSAVEQHQLYSPINLRANTMNMLQDEPNYNQSNSLRDLQENVSDETHRETLHDPATLKPKGRPRTQRLTGALEGHARGGGGRKRSSTSAAGSEQVAKRGRPNRCGVCRQEGHNQSNCSLLPRPS